MSQLLAFARLAAQTHVRVYTERLRALLASASFDPGQFAEQQFVRYAHYQMLSELLRGQPSDRKRVVEFGGSNQAIRSLFPSAEYTIADDYPAVDVQSLQAFADGSYDVVVADQVLEHVAEPQRAVAEFHRILVPGGQCICTTPFLLQIHNHPADYYRFTETGLAQLFQRFSQVDVRGWGNRYTLEVISRYGWLSAKNTKRLLHVASWNEPEWPIVFLTIATK